MTSRKQIIKGFGDQDPDVESFVKPSNTDYYKHEASGHGYNARWADNYDDARSAVGFSRMIQASANRLGLATATA